MSEPETFTAAQAADPQTPPQMLADIAALRPDLRPAVAANPSTYPALLEWLGGLGEPSVDAALAARQPIAAGPPVAAPQQPAYQQPAPTASLPPQGQYAPSGPAAGAPYGQQVPPSGYGYAGTPPAKKSHKALWIVLGVVGLLIVLGIVAVVLAANAIRNAADDVFNGSYGSDTTLDALWDRCADGDWQACDDLYRESPLGSAYEDFGDTCGNRQSSGSGTYCVDSMGGAASDPIGEGPSSFGDDGALDALWVSCDGGDWQACDDLYWQSPVGSEYESFGDTCGNRTTGDQACVAELGEPSDVPEPSGEAFTYGDDAYLDGLWDSCEGGDWQACDDLFLESPFDSMYESYGDTCGDRQPEGTGDYCVDSMG